MIFSLTMFPLVVLSILFSFPIACIAQQITHISQVPSITDLPCLSQKLVQAYTQLRYANCPQKTPQAYASCLCLQPTNVASVQSSMAFWGSLDCADRSSVDSSMAMGVFTLYCNLAMKEEAVTVTTDPGITAPLRTGVGSRELPLSLLGNLSSAFMLQIANYCSSSISCHNRHVEVNNSHSRSPRQPL